MATSYAAEGNVAESASRAPPRSVLWAIAVAGLVAAAGTFALAFTGGEVSDPFVHSTLIGWITVPYILSGVVAWWRRPDSRFGPLMIAAGFATFLSTLALAGGDLLSTIGQTADVLPPALFLHVFLAFPTGRLHRRFEQALVTAGYVAGFGLTLVVMTLGGYGSSNLLEVVAKPDVALTVQRVQLVAVSALSLAGIGVLALRRRGTGPPLRRSLALLIDAFALGLVMIAVLFMSHLLEGPAIEPIRWATFAVIGMAPIAFLIGLLQARLVRSALGELLVELRADPAPADLRDALARALRDPSLALAYWLPDYGTYTDLEGREFELPEQDDRRATTLIERDGARVAALLHDVALEDERELLDAVTAAAGIALENARLHAELRARLEELRGSRARIVDAGQKERQRLERNLHDGAQHRLVALSLQLSLLEEQLAGDSSATAQLEQARAEIDTSLDELREIAQGIHPAVVSAHGLPVALEQLAALAQVPVCLTVEIEGRLPEAVEVAAYYLISETLANVGKYAQASSATVEVVRSDGQIRVEVIDDGVGGADTERGSGLRGLADRVEALGGRLRVWSPPGGGTRVSAEIPCAS